MLVLSRRSDGGMRSARARASDRRSQRSVAEARARRLIAGLIVRRRRHCSARRRIGMFAKYGEVSPFLQFPSVGGSKSVNVKTS